MCGRNDSSFFFFLENGNSLTFQAASLHLKWPTLFIRQNANIPGVAAAERGAGELRVFRAHQELLHEASVLLSVLSASFKQIAMGLNHKAGISKEIVNDPFIYRSQKKLP